MPGDPEWAGLLEKLQMLERGQIMFLRLSTIPGIVWESLWITRTHKVPYIIGGHNKHGVLEWIQWGDTWEKALEIFEEDVVELRR